VNDDLNKPDTELEIKLKQQAAELASLKQQLEQLEHILAKKVKEIRETQYDLIQSEKLAVIAQLASGVGHELRSPLGVIKASAYFLKMMLGENIDERIAKHIRLLENAVSASDKIITDLLDFARPGSTNITEVNINLILKETMGSTSLPSSIQLSYNLDDSLPAIRTDAHQLNQIFSNLILNAIQAMPEGGSLTLTTKLNNDSVEASVRDTGVGIEEEKLDKIFEPLYTAKAKGIGLGLALVKNLLDGQGCSIAVQSQVDNGSTFKVTFPLASS